MQRQPLQAFVQQFDLLNVIELDTLCMHLTDHLHEYLEQTQVSVTHLLPGQCTRALILTIRDVINKSAQKDHMRSFVGIDPQGVAKISQTLLISFEEREARLQKPLQLNQEIVLECLTDCMRRIRLEIAKERIAEVKNMVEDEYRNTGTPMPIEENTNSLYQFRQRRAVND